MSTAEQEPTMPPRIKAAFGEQIKAIERSAPPKPNGWAESDLKTAFFMQVEYSLRMLWLGRVDKLSSESIPMLNWMTTNHRPAGSGEFSGFANGKIQFQGHNHHELARDTCDLTFEALKGVEGLTLPIEAPKKTLLQRLTRR